MSTAAPALAGDAAPPAEREHAHAGRPGAFPWLVLAAAAGLALVAMPTHSRAPANPAASPLFWPGLALIVFPAALRLTGEEASSGERAATVVLVGLALYGIKVLRDPFEFTFADELAHLRNLQNILETGRLFESNSILPVTPHYPGLESLASAGSPAPAGSSVRAGRRPASARPRSVVPLASTLAFTRISAARAGSLGALLYAATPTFLYFAAQFSTRRSRCRSMTVVIVRARPPRRRPTTWPSAPPGRSSRSSSSPASSRSTTSRATRSSRCCSPSHHAVGDRPAAGGALDRHGDRRGAGAGWLGLVASSTIEYLRPVLSDALDTVVDTLQRESETRTLFRSTGSAESTPVGERLVALAGVALVAAGVLAGLHARRREWRRDPVLLVFGLAAVGYLGTLPFRLVPAAWETASRAGSFLFVGVGITAAAGLALVARPPGLRAVDGAWLRPRRSCSSSAAASSPVGPRACGSRSRSASGRRPDAGAPQVRRRRWSGRLGTDRRFGAEDADARLLLVDGRQTAFQGVNPAIADLLDAERSSRGMRTLLRDKRIALLMTDRRKVSGDNILGYFFDVGRPALAPAATAGKFDRPDVDRLYDDGAIVVYDVRGLR